MAMTAVDFADKYGMSVGAAQDTMDRYVANPSDPEFAGVAGIMRNATGVRYTGSTAGGAGAGAGAGAGGVTCPYDGATFGSQAALDAHIATVHPTVPWIPGGGNDTVGGTNMPITGGANDTTYFPEYSPFAYYAKQRGIPGYGMSPAQTWQRSQFNPLYGTYLAQSALNPGGYTDWGQYSNAQPADYGRQAALGSLRQGAGLVGKEQQGFLDVLGDYLPDVIYNALRQMYAAPIAQRMSSRLGGLEQQYAGETQGAGNEFLSYVLRKYGIA